ncbi:hypothetical protein OHA21_33075 [Actinoplanes sp. NBC_00393]|uniref:hypothetical protein n=1 Tax=Actinoplanes sp. NBC_00393 TaxID=2975953 RepID=UPI002E1F27E4
MERRPMPRGLVARATIAAALFAVAVVPGWTFGDLAEQRTGRPVLDWLVTCGWSGLAVAAYAPWSSHRRRDGWLGAVPLYGWYLAGILSWRLALLPYRDWEPRPDEQWQARWLTGDLLGYWRADAAGTRPVTGARRPATARRTR